MFKYTIGRILLRDYNIFWHFMFNIPNKNMAVTSSLGLQLSRDEVHEWDIHLKKAWKEACYSYIWQQSYMYVCKQWLMISMKDIGLTWIPLNKDEDYKRKIQCGKLYYPPYDMLSYFHTKESRWYVPIAEHRYIHKKIIDMRYETKKKKWLRENHTYPMNIMWLSEIAVNPVENI